MSSFSARSVRWLARLLASRAPGAGDVAPGVEAALDGATAVALAESLWCDVACLGATFPASIAARAWTRRLDGANAFGARPSAIEAESGAGALAAAIGASSAGARATAFISGQDLASCAELLHLAAGRRIPLVLHVATRMPAGSGVAFGGGHATWHSAADAGWIQLFATNVQEAVDLSLAARLAAERALIPVMIGIDGPETALAAQDVLLPEPALAAELLGAAGRRIKPPTPAQRIIFGEYREAVPRWHDLDEPALHGSVEPPEMAQNAAAAGSMFFGAHAQQAIDDAFARVGRRTGRELSSLRASNARAAELVIIAVGAVIEAAEIAAEHLRRRDGISVAVVGVRQCRPWPAAALRQRLAKARVVLTLERAEAPLGGSLLLRDVRSAADPAAAVRYCAAIHGVGGVAATPAQIAAACRRALAETIETLRIGVAVAPDAPSPKRQAILDAVRRDYPDAERQSVVAGPDDATATGFTIAVHRPAGAADESFAGQAAALLHSLAGGRLRTCAALEPPAYGAPATDVLMFGDGVPPGAEHADVAVLVASESGFCERQLQTLPSESVLIVPVSEQDPGPIDGDLAARLQQRRVRLVGAPVPAPRAYEQPAPAWRRHEALLGALAALVAGTLAGREITAAKAVAARRLLLDDLAPPDVQTRLEVFQAGFERHAPYAPDASAPAASPVPPPAPPPAPKFAGRPVKNPAEHWARTAAPAMQRRAVAPADPFAACGVTPAGTSARRSIAGPELLEFDPETCDGSAAPWVGCPDGAIAAVALGARELLECGIRMATRAGASADALTPVVGKLAQFAHKQALAAVRPPSTARELLEAPYHELVEKMAPEEARKAALDDAFRAVLDAIGMLPIVRTGALFDALEQAKAASGAFLIIGIDPDASRDPRSAAQDALGHGLRLVNRTPARLERARALWRIFEALPDTPGAIIAHAADQPSIGPMGAILLSRSCAMALATGDDAEPGSGDRLAVRLVLAACEAEIQPRTQRFLEQIRTLRDRLGARIHETLAGSLPDADLDALAEGLRTLGRDDVDLAELGRRVAGASESRRLDGVALSRLVDAARSLADLEWRLTAGPSGAGRARTGAAIALGAGTLWATTAPFNPLRAPACLDLGATTPQLARGLLEGHAAAALDAARTVRWARAELERPGEAARAVAQLRALRFSDLSAEERGACAPVLLIGDDSALTRSALGSLLWLLSTDLAVKVLLLSGAGGQADSDSGVDAFGAYPAGSRLDVSLLAMLSRRAYVLQTSVAAPDHLADGVRSALRFDGPALICVHCPSPQRHGFPAPRTLDQARLAVASRSFPLLRFDPAGAGVFGSCLDLRGNPALDALLARAADGKPLTPADWAITESRFRPRFQPLPGAGTPVDKVLTKAASERDDAPARVTDPLDKSAWAADPALLAWADDRLRLWRTLQEIAGVVTPFTQRVREDAERAVADEHARQIADLKRQHETALEQLRADFNAEAATRVRDGLLALAGYSQREGGDS